MSDRLVEGRKSNTLKILSQLHAYLKRYTDLDKTEERFRQRLEDAGCTDMYAVIDDVLDIVDAGKKSEKARALNKIYKKYFPKAAAKEPASDEEVEQILTDEENAGETGIDAAAEAVNPETTLGDLRKGDEGASDEPTLGDIRKTDEEYMAGAENEEDFEDESSASTEEPEELEESRKLREELDDAGQYSIDDLAPGMIVNCGAYGDGIVVCSITDDHRFWGTDDKEDYFENGENASGWYFDVSSVEDIVGSVSDNSFEDGDDDDFDLEFEGDESFDDDELIEHSIVSAKSRAKVIREAVEPDGSTMPLDDSEDEVYVDDDADVGDVDLSAFEVPNQALAGTRHQPDLSGSLNDEVFDFIEDMKAVDPEITDEDLVDSIVEEFSDEDFPMERGMASDILEEYNAEKNPKNAEATSGDIEDVAENMLAEGFPKEEVLNALTRRFKLTQHEIEMILGSHFFDSFGSSDELDHDVDEYPLDEAAEGENRRPFFEAEDDVGDVSNFKSPVGERKPYTPSAKPSKAAHPEAMNKVKAILTAIGIDPRRPFIDGQTHGYRVKLGEYNKPEDIEQLQHKLDAAGYPEIKARPIGTRMYSHVGFTVPYDSSLNEMVGPKDQGGQSAPVPNNPAPKPYDTSSSDMSSTASTPSDNTNDLQQMTKDNPDVANFFDAMAQLKPEDMQNLTQMLGQK